MRSKMIVPGDRPDLMAQAVAMNPDAISLDLEDMVRPERKAAATADCLCFISELSPSQRAKVIVRVNDPGSAWIEDDLSRFVGLGLMMINVPKTESADEVQWADAKITQLERERNLPAGGTRLLVNVETPRSLRHALPIASASSRVVGVQIGFADMLEPIGITRSDLAALHQIKLLVKLACAEAGVDAFDGGFPGLEDNAAFEAEVQSSRRLGFAGKSCLTLDQVQIANRVFTPTAAEVQAARRVVEAADAAFAEGIGMVVVDGDVLDEPLAMGARRLLERAQRYGQSGGTF